MATDTRMTNGHAPSIADTHRVRIGPGGTLSASSREHATGYGQWWGPLRLALQRESSQFLLQVAAAAYVRHGPGTQIDRRSALASRSARRCWRGAGGLAVAALLAIAIRLRAAAVGRTPLVGRCEAPRIRATANRSLATVAGFGPRRSSAPLTRPAPACAKAVTRARPASKFRGN